MANRPHWRTRLIQSEVAVPGGFRSLAPAVHRASTTLFERIEDASSDWRPGTYTYGLYGTPTTVELGLRIAELEGATHTLVVPGGQAALTLVYSPCAGRARTSCCRSAPTAPIAPSPTVSSPGSGSRSRPTIP